MDDYEKLLPLVNFSDDTLGDIRQRFEKAVVKVRKSVMINFAEHIEHFSDRDLPVNMEKISEMLDIYIKTSKIL